MPSDPLTPPGPAQPRPYYVAGKPLWIANGREFVLIHSDDDADFYADAMLETIEGEDGDIDWRGPYDPSLLWQQPQLPAGTVALLLEAADCIDGLLGQVAWTSDRHTEYCEPLAASLRAEAGKGEGTT